MAHNQRLNPDTFYRNGVLLPSSFHQNLDTAQSKSVNADAGGTWNPTAPIQIAGVAFCGPTTTGGGATIVTPVGSGKRIVHADNDVPVLPAGQRLSARTLITSIQASGQIAGPKRWNSGVSSGYQVFQYASPVQRTSGALSVAVGKRILLPLRVHHGASFTQAVLDFKVIIARSVLPDNLPKMRIYAVDVFGDITPLAAPPMPGIAIGGWLQLDASHETPGVYSNLGQQIIYDIIPGVVIDATSFAYMAEIVDESSFMFSNRSQPGNNFKTVTCAFSNIAELGFQ